MGATPKASAVLMLALLHVGCDGRPQRQVVRGLRTVSQGTQEIREDRYYQAAFSLTAESQVQVTLSHKSGPAVDVYFLTEEGMNTWTTVVSKGQSRDAPLERYDSLGIEGLSVSFTSPWVSLPAGRYFLILDNTDYGATHPPMNMVDDVATIDHKLKVRQLVYE